MLLMITLLEHVSQIAGDSGMISSSFILSVYFDEQTISITEVLLELPLLERVRGFESHF